MANEILLRSLIDEAAAFVSKTVPEADRDAAAGVWARALAKSADRDVADAVDRWTGSIGDGRQVHRLPTAAEISSLIRQAHRPLPSEEPAHHTPPSPEFLAAHRSAAEQIKKIQAGHSGRPAHRHPNGNSEGCRRCRIDAQVRAEIDVFVRSLPQSRRQGPKRCQCAGTGFIDTPATVELLYSQETGDRAVTPCPTHGPPSELTRTTSTATAGPLTAPTNRWDDD